MEVFKIVDAVGALSVYCHPHHPSTCPSDFQLSTPTLLCLTFPLATKATLSDFRAGLAFWEMNSAVFPSSATALSNDSQNMVYKYPDPQALQ